MQLENMKEVTVSRREEELQRAVVEIHSIVIKYNLRISVNKTKTMAMKR
jgi:hypothetical protein